MGGHPTVMVGSGKVGPLSDYSERFIRFSA